MRRVLGLLLLLTLQVASGLLLSFALTYVLGFDNAAKLIIAGLGSGVAVWSVGAIARFRSGHSPGYWSLAITADAAGLGVLLILFAVPFSYAALLIPLLGALLGYHLGP